MRMKPAGLLVAALVLGTAGRAAAQSQGWAVTPYLGYTMPLTNLVEYNDASVPQWLQVEPSGGIMAGVTGELGLNKQFAISGFLSSTLALSQGASWHYSWGSTAADKYDVDYRIATTQLGATLVIRPLGRLPNGAPKVFFLEVGAGYTMFSVSDITSRQDSTEFPSWNSSSPNAVFGGGLTFRIGPRSTAVFFARYSMALSEYASDGLDDWNGLGTSAQVDPGQKANILFVGVGLRTGR